MSALTEVAEGSAAAITVQRRVPPAGIPSAASLRRFARAGLEGLPGEITLRLVDALESRQLNHQYRGKDYATNVLSFAYDPELMAADGGVMGDLVICADVVAREAAEQGKPAVAHWAHLVVHGCLHLRGFDHENDADAARMEARETAILADLGFPTPYET